MRDPKRAVLRLLVVVVAVAAAVFGLYTLGRHLEASQYGEERGDLSERLVTVPQLEYKGGLYSYRGRLVTILFLGIDQAVEDAIGQRGGGQADFLSLLILDPDNKTVRRLDINRDTMAEITTLGILGNISGTRLSQIALSHGFGDGREQSSELTVQAVERLLHGMPVDFYITLGMDSLSAVGDAVGGVPVLIEDDFSQHDPALKVGEVVTLHGDQIELYVRSRMSIGDGLNVSRMRRQNQFLASLMEIVGDMAREDANEIGALYDKISQYIITDMNRGRMINEAYKASDYETGETIEIAGEQRVGEMGFIEFYPDEDALLEMIVTNFYKKAD